MKKGVRLKFLSDPANRGMHLVIVAGKVFRARNGNQAKRVLQKIRQEYPKQKVTLTYIPKADTLILL